MRVSTGGSGIHAGESVHGSKYSLKISQFQPNKTLVFFNSNVYTICESRSISSPGGAFRDAPTGSIEDTQFIFINSKPPHERLFSGCLEFVFTM
jgi:hypothetical protein